jgi:AhpD family alkylhydroperoxidase
VGLDTKTIELAAIAAAVGCNCIPCLKYHFEKGVQAGCTKEEIEEIVKLANMVKQTPAKEITKVAGELVTGAEGEAPGKCPCGQ